MMTPVAQLVKALYQHLGTWKDVADAVNGEHLDHGPGYYWQIARGRIREPRRAVVSAIYREARTHLASDFSVLKCPRSRAGRGGLTCTLDTRNRLRRIKERSGETWEQLLRRAADLLEKSDV